MKTKLLLFLTIFSFSSAFGQLDEPDDRIIARNNGYQEMWDGKIVRMFGFARKINEPVVIPSPTIYLTEGDIFDLLFSNISQGAPHTIHPHGLDVDQANDGVPGLSPEIEHAEKFTYRIPGPHPGTYIYHCHVVSTLHVELGMYGFMIVRPRDGSQRAWVGGPEYDKEYMWMTSEVDSYWHTDSIAMLHAEKTEDNPMGRLELPPYRPDYFLVNGKSRQQLTDSTTAIYAAAGEKIILRLANMGFYKHEFHIPTELNPVLIATDGRPIPEFRYQDKIDICPGERYDFMLYPAEEFNSQIKINYINMNSDVIHDTQVVPVNINGVIGKEDIPDTSFEIFPNPSKGSFSIQLDYPSENFHYSIMDMYGQKVSQGQIPSGLKSQYLSTPTMADGVYFVTLLTDKGHFIGSQKLIIRK